MNRNRFNRSFDDHMTTPFMFKLFFGIIAAIVIGVFVLVAWGFVQVLTNPEIVGEMAGKVVNGFENTISR